MSTLLLLIGWSIVLLIWPFVWLLSIPLRLVGITMSAVLALIKTILFLPARLLGHRA